MKTVGLIPVRLESTRLKEKALLPILGMPLIAHVWNRAKLSDLDDVYICTDSKIIADLMSSMGAKVIITSRFHTNGTSRIAEAATALKDQGLVYDVYLDIQGDDPLVNPLHINQMLNDHNGSITVAISPCLPDDLNNRDVVKVVPGLGTVLYMSRAPVPCSYREDIVSYKHQSLIGFDYSTLFHFALMDVTPLELAEGIELMRAIEHGVKVNYSVFTDHNMFSVDNLEFYNRACSLMASDTIAPSYLQPQLKQA